MESSGGAKIRRGSGRKEEEIRALGGGKNTETTCLAMGDIRGGQGGSGQTCSGSIAAWPICNNLCMCGRYRLSRRKQIIEKRFDSVSGEEDWSPRYNVAPTQPVPIIRQHPKEPRRDLSLVRWSLIPPWAKHASGAAGMINGRLGDPAWCSESRRSASSARILGRNSRPQQESDRWIGHNSLVRSLMAFL
jgi:hypothetical protein